MNNGNYWSDEAIVQLRELWTKGLTAGEMMDQMPGRTRSAIIGKAHRLGLPARTNPVENRPDPFERLVDLVADENISVAAAASRVSMSRATAERRWAELCDRFGWRAA